MTFDRDQMPFDHSNAPPGPISFARDRSGNEAYLQDFGHPISFREYQSIFPFEIRTLLSWSPHVLPDVSPNTLQLIMRCLRERKCVIANVMVCGSRAIDIIVRALSKKVFIS